MPTPRLLLALAAASLLAACGPTVAAGVGESCGPSHGCAADLVCDNGTCQQVAMGDGGTVTDAGPGDGGVPSDGGTTPDGGTSDGGTSDGGTTTDGGTTCGPCDTPPDACHATQGSCVNGACVYPVVDGATCDDGDPCTVQDTCTAGVCAGIPMVCNTPPAPACLSGTELSTYDQNGVCQGGRCTYTRKTLTCGTGGCVNNACQTDPCASMTCNTPPSVCYGTAGTCSAGSCSYPYADGVTCDDGNACTTNDQCNTGVCKGTPMACDTPPASTCQNASTAKIYAPAGTCSAGTCSYTYTFVTCATGCANGACNPSGWTTMNSHSSVDLYAVWGTSATDVWAAGAAGTTLHFNGATWSTDSTGVSLDLQGLTGTSSTDVFAIAEDSGLSMTVLHYDGTRWTQAGTVPTAPATYPIPAQAIGPDDLLVGGYVLPTSSTVATSLDEVRAGVVTHVVTGGTDGPLALAAFGLGDVYANVGTQVYHFDGTALSKVTTPGTGAYALWAASPSAVFASATGNVQFYDGTQWSLENTAYAGTLYVLSGSSATRVFALGESGAVQTILIYDGSSWTPSALPAGTQALHDIWAAPDGEVFAVGNAGTILRGP